MLFSKIRLKFNYLKKGTFDGNLKWNYLVTKEVKILAVDTLNDTTSHDECQTRELK